MIDNWQSCSLEEVVKFIDYRGRTPKKTETGLRLITAKNVKMGYLQSKPMEFVDPEIYDTWMTRGIPKRGDVLFTTEAPLGNIAQLDTDERVVFAQRIIVMQPDREVLDPTFLKYMLLSDLMQKRIHEKGTGATVQGIKAQLLKKIQISFPIPLREQKRIVAIVDEAFEGIDRAIVNTEKNFTNARELFESYLNTIFTQKGDGWIEKQLGDIAELIDSLHKTPSYIDEGGFPMVRVTDIKDGVLNLANARRVDEATFIEFSKRHTPKVGDIVFSRVGSYGVPALVQSDDLFCLGQNTVFIIPKIDSQLLYFFLRSPNSQEQIEKFVAGTTQGTISLRSIKQIRVPIPPSSEQVDLAAKLNSVLRETKRLEAIYCQKLAALNELKQSILQKAFTGELTSTTSQQATETAKEVVAA